MSKLCEYHDLAMSSLIDQILHWEYRKEFCAFNKLHISVKVNLVMCMTLDIPILFRPNVPTEDAAFVAVISIHISNWQL